MTIEALRTPDERFVDLPDWPYAPRYVDDLPGYEGLRAHHVDEGPADAEHVFLCLHGEPTWSYLYRKMIPVFLEAGGRVVAPDFFGFGRSDKPVAEDVYGFHFHRDFLFRLIERLDLRRVTLVVQDWGGLLGLTLPHAMPDRFARLIVMNTAIATGAAPSKGFEEWRAYVRSRPDLECGKLMKRSMLGVTDAEAAAYDAPFPDIRHKAGVRRFPDMVMTDPGMEGVAESKRAVGFWREEWTGPSFMAVGLQDPVMGAEGMERLRGVIRGCPPPMQMEATGHFVQEHGEPVARAALAHFANQD